jgi:hypothetical protein
VIDHFSRRDLFSRGAKGGAALVVAGSSFGLLAGAAAADTFPDGDLAYLRMLIATELLGADFYDSAVKAEPYGNRGQKQLKLALFNESEHYTALSNLFAGAGQTPTTADDIDFSYPKGSFDTTAAVTKLAVTLETLFLGAYLGAVAGVQTGSLKQPLAQIAANQAQHLSVFAQLLGHPGFQGSFPAPITIDAVSDELATYTS